MQIELLPMVLIENHHELKYEYDEILNGYELRNAILLFLEDSPGLQFGNYWLVDDSNQFHQADDVYKVDFIFDGESEWSAHLLHQSWVLE